MKQSAFIVIFVLVSGCLKPHEKPAANTPQPAVAGSAATTQVPQQTAAATQAAAVPSPTPSSNCYKASAFICDVETQIIALTNQKRGSRGALTGDAKLSFAARQWSAAQAKMGDISHAGFPNARYKYLQTEFGNNGTIDMLGENVAFASAGIASSASQVAAMFVQMWWSSSGHRENMLRDWHMIGVGVYEDAQGGWTGTQIFGDQ